MASSLWTMDGKVLVDALGQPIWCDHCPCPGASSGGSVGGLVTTCGVTAGCIGGLVPPSWRITLDGVRFRPGEIPESCANWLNATEFEIPVYLMLPYCEWRERFETDPPSSCFADFQILVKGFGSGVRFSITLGSAFGNTGILYIDIDTSSGTIPVDCLSVFDGTWSFDVSSAWGFQLATATIEAVL